MMKKQNEIFTNVILISFFFDDDDDNKKQIGKNYH